jgi:hypothetical protein
MMVIFVLYTPRDVALAKIILLTCPHQVKIIVPNFYFIYPYPDEYKWKKTKKLRNNFTISEKIELFKEFPNGKINFVFSVKKFKKILLDSILVIDRGLTFFTLKPIAKNNLALSLNRCYLNRLLDVLPYYKEKELKISMHSDLWFNNEDLGEFCMGQHSYDSIKQNSDSFIGIDILGYNYDLLKKIDIVSLKKELGLPLDKKIVLLSCRMCGIPNWSVFRSDGERYILSIKKELTKLKKEGYFIVSRRRLGKHDIAYYKKHNWPDFYRFSELSDLIDIELNGVGGTPGMLYRLLYVSDLMYMPDISGIAYVEAALMRCPVYMPYNQEWVNRSANIISPAIDDMVKNKLIFNILSDSAIIHYKRNIDKFLARWYNTDIDKFWSTVLKK